MRSGIPAMSIRRAAWGGAGGSQKETRQMSSAFWI